MFLSNLTENQQGVFLGLADQVIMADKKILPQEETLLSVLKAQMSPDVKPIHAEELDAVFTTKKERASVLLELLGLAHADEEYHVSERDLINSIAAKFGVSMSELLRMEEWVMRQFELVREANQLMEN